MSDKPIHPRSFELVPSQTEADVFYLYISRIADNPIRLTRAEVHTLYDSIYAALE